MTRPPLAGAGAENGVSMTGNNGRMGIAPLNQGKTQSDDREKLRLLVSQNGSLLAVSVATGLNVGYLSAIRSGRRRASNRARIALGLKPRSLPAPACQRCGAVHTTKKCTANKPPATFIDGSYRRMTVGETAPDYDAWLARNAGRIAKIVEWANGGVR